MKRPERTLSVLALIPLLFFTTSGCGSSAPDVAGVKKLMTSDQLALGDPIINSVEIVLVPIPAGEFQMGTSINNDPVEKRYEKLMQNPDVQKKIEAEEVTKEDLMKHVKQQVEKDKQKKGAPDTPQHLVKITKPYYLSVCEVTQQQFEKVMGSSPWKGKPLVQEGSNYAATYVSWDDAVEFCKKLSEQENAEYRLPTEAEWEYACRAGTASTYSFGDKGGELTEYAWYDANAYKEGEQYAHRVGQKLPNAWGLYDMHGNTWEWCQDWYAPYNGKQKEAVDPTGPKKGRFRVWRGGSFAEAMPNTRSATRLSYGRPGYRPEYLVGFRVVKTFDAK